MLLLYVEHSLGPPPKEFKPLFEPRVRAPELSPACKHPMLLLTLDTLYTLHCTLDKSTGHVLTDCAAKCLC